MQRLEPDQLMLELEERRAPAQELQMISHSGSRTELIIDKNYRVWFGGESITVEERDRETSPKRWYEIARFYARQDAAQIACYIAAVIN
jgi:hypothetical protein